MSETRTHDDRRGAARGDPRGDAAGRAVFCIGEDIGIPGGFGGAFTVTLGLSEEFGHERILDTPISEAGIAGVAVGRGAWRACGRSPTCSTPTSSSARWTSSSTRPRRCATCPAASYGADGHAGARRRPRPAAAQHGQSPESFFIHVPGLKVACPSTAYDAKGLLKTAIRDDNPVLFFEHKLLYGSKGMRAEKGALSPVGEVPEEDYLIPFGQGAIRREGPT